VSAPHPAALDAAYGRIASEPIARCRFTLDGATPITVTPLEGSRLRHDAGMWPRGGADLILPTTITPSMLPASISAYGGRVTITLGAKWRGREHVFTAATLAVAEVDIDRPDARVAVHATTFEALVNEDRYTEETPTPAGKVSAIVSGIVARTLGAVPVVNTLGALDVSLVAGAYVLDGDVWPVVEEIMTQAGGEAWFDAAGQLILRPIPVVGAPTLEIAAGRFGALTGYSSSRVWGPNRVALVYQSPAAKNLGLYYRWTAARTAAPASGHVSVNTANPLDATIVYVHRVSASGQDVAESFAGFRAGDTLTVGQEVPNAPDKRLRYIVSRAGTIGPSVISIPVELAGSQGTEPAGDADVEVGIRIAARRRVGMWEDTVATSPTRVGGPYGRHTYRETIDVDRGALPTQTQANANALAVARRVVGRLRTVDVRAIPAPWLTPGDTVRLGMLGGLIEDHVVQAVELPLPGLDVMTVTTRDAAYTGGPF
jgi:hypothetical protein